MNDKPIVSEILPAGAACARWLAEGDNARAVPFVAFAAGWKARDAEVEALVKLADALADEAERWERCDCAGDEHTHFSHLWDAVDAAKAYRAARRTGGG